MSKQTAVQYLIQYMMNNQYFVGNDLADVFDQAKAMEKEQIIEAWDGGNYGYFYSKGSGKDFNDGLEYYKEVYKGGEQ